VIVYSVVDDALSTDFPLPVDLEVFICREDAERFVEEVLGVMILRSRRNCESRSVS
jgi:hypothetical protein